MFRHQTEHEEQAAHPTPKHNGHHHPHYSDLVWGLLEARMSHVSYMDTIGGDELLRVLDRREPHHRARA